MGKRIVIENEQAFVVEEHSRRFDAARERENAEMLIAEGQTLIAEGQAKLAEIDALEQEETTERAKIVPKEMGQL